MCLMSEQSNPERQAKKQRPYLEYARWDDIWC